MSNSESDIQPNRFENLIPPDSALANSRTVYGQDIEDILGEIQKAKGISYVMILGEPGSGKTVILREFAELFQKNRPDKKVQVCYYDDIHYLMQEVTSKSSSEWAKGREEGSPDFWVLASSVVYKYVSEKKDNEVFFVEGVWSGEEDRLRSTTLQLLMDKGKANVGIIYILPHPDVQQSAVNIRDWVNIFAKPEDVVEGLRAMGVEPNPKFEDKDPVRGQQIKDEFAKSAKGFEIAEISAEVRELAFKWLDAYKPILDELLSEILNPDNPDIPPFMGEVIRVKAVLVIEEFSMLGIEEMTPIVNLPVKNLNLYIQDNPPLYTIDINLLKNLVSIVENNFNSGKWDKQYINKWFPNLRELRRKYNV